MRFVYMETRWTFGTRGRNLEQWLANTNRLSLAVIGLGRDLRAYGAALEERGSEAGREGESQSRAGARAPKAKAKQYLEIFGEEEWLGLVQILRGVEACLGGKMVSHDADSPIEHAQEVFSGQKTKSFAKLLGDLNHTAIAHAMELLVTRTDRGYQSDVTKRLSVLLSIANGLEEIVRVLQTHDSVFLLKRFP